MLARVEAVGERLGNGESGYGSEDYDQPNQALSVRHSSKQEQWYKRDYLADGSDDANGSETIRCSMKAFRFARFSALVLSPETPVLRYGLTLFVLNILYHIILVFLGMKRPAA